MVFFFRKGTSKRYGKEGKEGIVFFFRKGTSKR